MNRRKPWAAATLLYLLKRGGKYATLTLAASVGALSHVAFDLVSGASIKLGWPLLPGRARLPLVAMADPWLIAICAIGAGALWMLRRRAFTVAATMLAAIATVLALKGLLLAATVPQWRAATSADAIVHHEVEASWGSLTDWDVSDRTARASKVARRCPWCAGVVVLDTAGHGRASCGGIPLVRHGAEFSLGARSGICRQLSARPGNASARSDIRYYWSSTECALWFGGTFDRDGRPLRQVVHVGRWQQTRPVSP
jgi:hypothetical protein